MRLATCLVLAIGLVSCGGGPRGPVVTPDPETTTNRLVVRVDEESKISVRESGAILWSQGTPARIDDRGRVTDRWGKLLAWLHKDNIRLRGGASIPIRTGTGGEIFLSHKAQREAGLKVVEVRVYQDGSIAAGEGRVSTMSIESKNSPENRQLALLVLFMMYNGMLDEAANPEPRDAL